MREPSTIASTLRAWLRVDRGGIAWVPPIRIALVVAILYALTMDHLAVAIPLAIGAILVGVTDPSGSIALRVRGMGLALLTVTGATIAGGIVSSIAPFHLVAAFIAAAFYGYLGAFGPRAGFAGVVGLVTFAVFAGSPEPLGSVPLSVACVALGGIVQIAAAIAAELLGRMDAVRTDLFLAWHGLGIAMRGPLDGTYGADVSAHVSAARERVRAAGEQGDALAWLDALATSADRVRIAAIALATARETLEPPASAAIGTVIRAGGTAAIRIAEAIHLPFGGTRLRRALDAFDRVAERARTDLPREWIPVVELLHRELHAAAALAGAARPAGSRSLTRLRAVLPPRSAAGAVRRDPTGVFRRHAIRLAVTFTIATLPTLTILDLPHAYWVPMTVAWLMKPGFGVTTTRVVSRIAGTLGGMAVIVIVLGLFPSAGAAVVLAGITMAIACAFVTANYALCTAGVTGVVLVLFTQAGDPIVETALLRIGGTLAGALLTAIAIFAWRPRQGDTLAGRLATQARALGTYVDAVRERSGRHDAPGAAAQDDPGAAAAAPAAPAPAAGGYAEAEREALVRARLATLADAESAAVELGHHRISPSLARELAHDLVVASAIPAVIDLTGDRGLIPELHDAARAALDRLAARIAPGDPGAPPVAGIGGSTALTPGPAPAPGPGPEPAPGPGAVSPPAPATAPGAFAAPVVRAHGRLDAAGL